MSTPEPTVQELVDAVCGADLAAVRAILDRAPDLVYGNDCRSFGSTPLIQAVGRGDRAMVDLLLERGADPNQRSDWWAGSFGVLDSASEELSRHLMARGARLDAHAAARLGWLDELHALLDCDPSWVHARGGDGQLPLHFAATVEVAKLLLERGARLDTADIDHGSTAVQWLATSHPDVAAWLLDHGAKADVVIATILGDVERLGPLLAAAPESAQMRITRESFPVPPPAAGHIYLYTVGEGCTLLHAAAQADSARSVSFLIERGADPNARGGYDDATPLHTAAWHDRPAAVRALLEGGADVDALSGPQHRNEPIGWAIVAGSSAAAQVLLEHGCRVREHHRDDARAGASGAFRGFRPERPLDRWLELARLF